MNKKKSPQGKKQEKHNNTEQNYENWNGVGDFSKYLKQAEKGFSNMAPLGTFPDKAMARLIDHTNLKADATEKDIQKLCKEAEKNNFMSVCVNSTYVALAARLLKDTNVKICTVVGFPLGASNTKAKVWETKEAIAHGANEIDMVINIGAMKSKNYTLVENDIKAVVKIAGKKALTKVILETCYLTKSEIAKACQLAKNAKADFVKTSTGFGADGAKVSDIKIMRREVKDRLGVKASGGIRDHETALSLIKAGASRIGASSSVAIVRGKTSKKQNY